MKRTITSLGLIAVMTLVLGFFDLPYSTQTKLIPALSTTEGEEPSKLETQNIKLGLDLQGGTQLDYKIDLRRVDEADQEQIIEGVLEVITRRVNGLGVSEPNIYRSQVADEEHIIVELAGIQNLEEAKGIVGKTIQLEFKEENAEPMNETKKEEIRTMAQTALDEILSGTSFSLVAQEEELAGGGQVSYFASEGESYTFKSDLPEEYFPYLDELELGEVIPELIETSDGYTMDTTGTLQGLEGYYLVQILDRREGSREEHQDKEVQASHILISYVGASNVDPALTRTQEEAQTLATEIQQRATSGEDFTALVAEFSEDAVSKAKNGDLGFFGPGGMVKPFEDAAYAMEIGEISEVVETEYGYHIITVTDIKEEVNTTVPEMEYKLEKLYFSTLGDPWKSTSLTGEHFMHADVQFDQNYNPFVSIQFNDEGGKLFEELTERNIGKSIGIFVGGDLISAPRVNTKITGGRAQIEGGFDIDEASTLARDLNTGAIPAPILLVGQYTIGASLGQDALDSSLKAGALGIAILMIYMLLYYRLPGLLADLALVLYAVMMVFIIKVAMPLWAALGLSIIIFTVVTSFILKSKDSGWEKLLAFLLACFILFFFSYLFANPIVMTLAGIAGVILSIGMAVDANILIFERVREELRNKRPLANAIEIGFERAWSSIRDSNFSSLITCAILMYFGSSIIKGFAVNLALGILVSMFTAITITRTLLRTLVGTKWGQNAFLMGVPKRGHSTLAIVQKRKIWFSLSALMIGVAIIMVPAHGLKLGLDFTGGTLMEVQFEQPVTPEALHDVLKQVETDLLATTNPVVTEPAVEEVASTPEDAPAETQLTPVIEDESEVIDFGEPVVVASGENTLLIRMKHTSNETHAAILAQFEESFGAFEETRFTTIGATVGSTMGKKAIFAIGMALVMIVLYIAFAFRQIPRQLNPWRFGVAAIVALLHDVFIPLGIFAVLGAVLGVEIDALFITAMLTVMGFSVHDTIVTFDRLRENVNHQKSGEDFETVANRAVNETLARSINTSLSTMITVAMLFLFGADSIKYFLLTLLIGIVVGTYSSILIATPLLVWWHKRTNK